MEVVAVFAIALVAAVVGIALGMLAAPAVGRLADRVGRPDDEELPDDEDRADDADRANDAGRADDADRADDEHEVGDER